VTAATVRAYIVHLQGRNLRRGRCTAASAADSYLLNAFAATFLSSATLKDGEFHIPGTFIGVLIIAIGFNGLAIFGAPTYQYIFQGAILVIAEGLSSVARQLAKR
jgi:ribose transport system permease protein